MRDIIFSHILRLPLVLAFVASPQMCNAELYSLHFAGEIDGSEVIHVSRDAATWEHRFWGWPTTVEFNGQSWTPQSNSTLTPASGSYLPDDLSQYLVEVVRTSNRDVATAGIFGDELRIFLADNPNGSGLFDIDINLIPKPALPVSTVATLEIIGRIDGSDRLTISQSQASWQHLNWATPTVVFLNTVNWNPSKVANVPNSGATQFLPAGIDFRSAQFAYNGGRDLANMEVFDDHLEIYFDDTPNGDAIYSVTVTFGVVPEPSSAALVLTGLTCAALVAIRRPKSSNQ